MKQVKLWPTNFLLKVILGELLIVIFLIAFDATDASRFIHPYLSGKSPFDSIDNIISLISALIGVFFSLLAYKFTAETTRTSINTDVTRLGGFSLTNNGQLQVAIKSVRQSRTTSTSRQYDSNPQQQIKKALDAGRREVLGDILLGQNSRVVIPGTLTSGLDIEDSECWFVVTEITGQDLLGRKVFSEYVHAWFNNQERVASYRIIYKGDDPETVLREYEERTVQGFSATDNWSLIASPKTK
jgi:hypothetical protein